MLKAKSIVDFKVASEKLIGEMFSAKDGGCEIFVSRVEVSEKVYKERCTQEIQKKQRQMQAVLCFDEIEYVVSVCRILYSMKYSLSSALYYDRALGKYYLILDDVYIKDIKFAFLTEYSTVIKSNFASYIREHYKCVCKRNTVENLARC